MRETPRKIVLDASALIASIYDEKGSELVEKYLPHCIISSVNLTEVASYIVRQGNTIGETTEMLKDLAIPVAEYDEPQAFVAAGMVKETSKKGLSLGDRACLALAWSKKLPVLTADRLWKEVNVGIKIELIR